MDLVVHISDWFQADIDGEYRAYAFGRTACGRAETVAITGYQPSFYISVANDGILSKVLAGLDKTCRSAPHVSAILRRKPLYGYLPDDMTCAYRQLTFPSLQSFKQARKAVYAMATTKKFGTDEFQVSEANVEPFIRLIHELDIQSAGWISVAKYERDGSGHVVAHVRDISHHDTTAIAPFRVMAFDIEVDSRTGAFPVAIGTYGKLAYEIADQFPLRMPTIGDVATSLGYALQGVAKGPLTPVFATTPVSPQIANELVGLLMPDIEQIIVRVDDTSTKADRLSALFASASKLPRLMGDSIIQIGATIHAYGCGGVSERFVATLGTCEPIEGARVVSCDSEEDLLLEFVNYVREADPDIVTGFNVFGFDFAYVLDRADELGLSLEMEFGRLTGDEAGPGFGATSFRRVMTSSSAAYGDNVMTYAHMPGRVLLDVMKVVQREHKLASYSLNSVSDHFIGDAKDDMTPQRIFALQKGSAADRATIAKYCIKDCELCNKLVIKLEIVANNLGMANVCSVPLQWIFTRGQSVKIHSLVLRECRKMGYVVPTLTTCMSFGDTGDTPDSGDDDLANTEADGYEGALVLDPVPGIYTRDPIAVLDFAALYPSSMISHNLSHDTIILDDRYRDLPGVEYVSVEFDATMKDGSRKPKTVTFVANSHKVGILPTILKKLLAARKNTRAKMKWVLGPAGARGTWADGMFTDGVTGATVPCQQRPTEPAWTPFELAVLEGLQLAYKVTSNSLYGQVGARFSAISLKDVAASTTATGRGMIMKLKRFVETEYLGGGKAEVVYGDTDSVFFRVECLDEHGNRLEGRDAIMPTIAHGHAVSEQFQQHLPKPHCAEMEKTLHPFIIFSKKRYTAKVYTDDDKTCKRMSMGLADKRRDYASVVKKVYGGCIDIILETQDIQRALAFARDSLQKLMSGQMPESDLVITKTLKGSYKFPKQIAHKCLADRQYARDPGSAPRVNDRVPYVFVKAPGAVLQGDRIENPEYARQHGLQIDFEYYAMHQLCQPLTQLFALAIDQIPGRRYKPAYYTNMLATYRSQTGDESKAHAKLACLKEKHCEELIFSPIVRADQLKRSKQSTLSFTVIKK